VLAIIPSSGSYVVLELINFFVNWLAILKGDIFPSLVNQCDITLLCCYCIRVVSNKTRDLRSFVIRFDFESYVRFEIRFVVMVWFEIFESSSLSLVIRKETIGGG